MSKETAQHAQQDLARHKLAEWRHSYDFVICATCGLVSPNNYDYCPSCQSWALVPYDPQHDMIRDAAG